MKTIKLSLLIAAGLVLGAATQAQVSLHLTGAVAFRGLAFSAITNLYTTGGAYLQNPSGNASTKNQVTWSGKIPALYGSQTVTIYANYNGAVAGVQNLAQGTPAAFLASPTNGITNLVNATTDLAFSSVYQATTPYTSPVLNDTIIGATPVVWVKSINSPAAITNITAQQINVFAANGVLPASYFTGNASDTADIHFITRDASAGQRLIVFRDAGFTGTPLEYTSPNNGTTWVADSTGITSTTTIVNALNAYGPAISYITPVDAINVTNGTVIAYNVVYPFTGSTLSSVSNNYAPVINGKYSLWGYEHILLPSGTSPSSNIGLLYGALTNAIVTGLTNYPYTLPYSALQVSRNADGGPVSP